MRTLSVTETIKTGPTVAKVASLFIASATFLAVATLSSPVQASTPLQRCVELSEYAEGVAKLRDEGVRLREVKEFNAERLSRGLVDAYDLAATITYRNSDVAPEDVRTAMLSGCIESVNEETARRAK